MEKKTLTQKLFKKEQFPQKIFSQILVLLGLAVLFDVIEAAVAFSLDKINYAVAIIDIICVIYILTNIYVMYKNTKKETAQLYLYIFMVVTGVLFVMSLIIAISGFLTGYALALIYGGLCATTAVQLFVYPKLQKKLEYQKSLKENDELLKAKTEYPQKIKETTVDMKEESDLKNKE